MQRRQFLSSAIAASTAALTATTAGAGAIDHAADDAEGLWPIDEGSAEYRELFKTVLRDEQYVDADPHSSGNFARKPVSDQIHRLKLLALMNACEWARVAGIKFQWLAELPHVTCGGCGESSRHGATECANCGSARLTEFDESTWRCVATLNGHQLTWEGNWDFEGEEPPADQYLEDWAVMRWGEGRLALLFMQALGYACPRDAVANADFADRPDGRIVFV